MMDRVERMAFFDFLLQFCLAILDLGGLGQERGFGGDLGAGRQGER
jgi:hypothetical protein